MFVSSSWDAVGSTLYIQMFLFFPGLLLVSCLLLHVLRVCTFSWG